MLNQPKKRGISDAIALIGFLILIVVVIWGAVHAARLAAPYVSSFFEKRSTAKIEVTSPLSVTAGQPFTIDWKYTPTSNGRYVFLYQCRSGLDFETPDHTPVQCGAAFPIATGNSLTLVPIYSGEGELQVPTSIIFIPEKQGAARAQGGVTLTIQPGGAAPAPEDRTQTDAKRPGAKPNSSSAGGRAGKSDLMVEILAVGVIHPITGQFMNVAPVNASDMVAVQFNITNIGESSTGTWYFEASLPTTGGFMYYSPAQAPLLPGDTVVNTLRFTDAAPGGGIISIQLDPANQIDEMSEGNNYASQHVYVPYYASPYIY